MTAGAIRIRMWDSIMALLRCWPGLLGILLLGIPAQARADVPPRTALPTSSLPARDDPGKSPVPSPAPGGEPASPTPKPLSLDLMKLPAGAVIVLCEEAREALRLLPKFVILSPQEYQGLQKQLEQLKAQLEGEHIDNPSSCKLTGHVEGDTAYLRAQFTFKTEQPHAAVNLGCGGAAPTAATLDKSPAYLQPGTENGFVLRVDTPGAHQAIVDLQVPLTPRRGGKGDRSFDLELPHAAITILEQFDLPIAVPEVRIGTRSVRTTPLDPQRSRLENVPVPIQHLTVAWKGPAAKPVKGPPERTAEGHIVVRVNETQVVTEAELTLQVQRGEAAEWRLRLPTLPAEAVLEIKTPPEESRIQSIERPNDKPGSLLTVHLNEPSAEPLRLTVTIRQPRSVGPLGIGPFVVLDALAQKGDIELRAADELRLRYQPAGEVSQREVGEEQRGQNVRAVFDYWSLPASAKAVQPPLLTVHVEAVKGAVETHVTQNLRLEAEGERSFHWQLTTRLEVTPIRTAVDHLEVTLPAEYDYDKAIGVTPADLVEDFLLDRTRHTAQIKLAHRQLRPFAVTLVGAYPVRAGQQEATLELLRPSWSMESAGAVERQTAPVLDRGCQVNVTLPEGFELVARPFRESAESHVQENAGVVFVLPANTGSRDYSWQGERTPARVELAWRAHRAEQAVDALVDVTLAGTLARVRQQLHYQFGPRPPSSVLVQVPAEVEQRVKIIDGGHRDAEESRTPGEWAVSIPETAGKEHWLTVEYSFPLPQPLASTGGQAPSGRFRSPVRRFTVPFLRPVQATRGETKVRIWCDPGEQPSSLNASWMELPTEIVPEQDSLPRLVLRGGHESTLLLRLTEPAVTRLSSPVLERVLVRTTVHAGGMQVYRVQFLLSKVNARQLDLELPILLAGSDLDVRLDGKRVPTRLVDENGTEQEVGRILRLQVEPDLYRKPVLLELSYQADSGRLAGNSWWQVTLRPPVLRNAILLGRARWQVDLAAGWMPISPQGGSNVEQHWGWWGWLPAPQPALSRAELEQWLGVSDSARSSEEGEPNLICWQSALGPLALVQVPQRVWLLVCSLTVLTLGLGLLLAPLPRWLAWAAVVVIGTVVAGMGVFAPAALPVLAYGCEPGALVLVVAVGAQWMLHQHYRRQVIFMPGFTRLKTGSSLIRTGPPRAHDPSTVDEPPKRPSTILPAAQPGNPGQ